MKQKAMRNNKHRMNPLPVLVPLLIFAAGTGIFLYPFVSNLLAEKEQHNTIQIYRAKVENMDQEEMEEAWKEAEIYNENLAGDPVHDPFIPGSGYVLPDNYEEVLNIDGDGVMGQIEIPSIEVNLPIYHGTDEETLEKGAGHLEMTALPTGGSNRHSVISAHRGLPGAELFTRLDEMQVGDVFYIHVLDRTLAYEVDQIKTVKPEDLSFLQPEKDKDLVTLLTCTPYAVNTHRLLVRGTRVPVPQAQARKEEQSGETGRKWIADYVLGVAGGVALLTAVWIFRRIRKDGKKRAGKEC